MIILVLTLHILPPPLFFTKHVVHGALGSVKRNAVLWRKQPHCPPQWPGNVEVLQSVLASLFKEGIARQEGDQQKMARVFQSVRKISGDSWSEVGFFNVEMRFQRSPVYYFSALEGI